MPEEPLPRSFGRRTVLVRLWKPLHAQVLQLRDLGGPARPCTQGGVGCAASGLQRAVGNLET